MLYPEKGINVNIGIGLDFWKNVSVSSRISLGFNSNHNGSRIHYLMLGIEYKTESTPILFSVSAKTLFLTMPNLK